MIHPYYWLCVLAGLCPNIDLSREVTLVRVSEVRDMCGGVWRLRELFGRATREGELMRGSGERQVQLKDLRGILSARLFPYSSHTESPQRPTPPGSPEFKYPFDKKSRSWAWRVLSSTAGQFSVPTPEMCSLWALTLELLSFFSLNRERSPDIWKRNGPHAHSQPITAPKPCDGHRSTPHHSRSCIHGYGTEHCEPSHTHTGAGYRGMEKSEHLELLSVQHDPKAKEHHTHFNWFGNIKKYWI